MTPKAKTAKDRKDSAEYLDEMDCGAEILVDNMDDAANVAYGALTERLYIVLDGKIVYCGGMGPFFYNLIEVQEFLNEFRESNVMKSSKVHFPFISQQAGAKRNGATTFIELIRGGSTPF